MIVCDYRNSDYIYIMKQNGYFRFRLSKDLLDKARAKAKKDNVKLSAVVREFFNEFVKEE